MECVICKYGTTSSGYVTVTLEKDNSIVLLKNVPAHICDNCGHYYLDSNISKFVLERANEAIKNGAELEVIKLQVA